MYLYTSQSVYLLIYLSLSLSSYQSVYLSLSQFSQSVYLALYLIICILTNNKYTYIENTLNESL